MFKQQLKVLIVIIYFFLSSLSYAEFKDESSAVWLQNFVKEFDPVYEMVRTEIEGLKENDELLTEADYNSLVNAANESLKTTNWVSKISLELNKNINDQELDELVAWFESDLTRDIYFVDKELLNEISLLTYEDMQELKLSLLSDLERVKLIEWIDLLTNSTEIGLQNTISAVIAITAVEGSISVEDMKLFLKNDRAEMKEEIRELSLIILSYTYRHIETSKLEQFVSSLANPTVEKFHKILISTAGSELETSLQAFTEDVIRIKKK